jgi:ABC transport system ATP-binding/permease protein
VSDSALEADGLVRRYGERAALDGLSFSLPEGQTLGLFGANGAGKTTLLRVLAGELAPSSGVVERGATLRLAYLSQDTAEIPGELRVLESLEAIKRRATLSDGREITAGMLAERFGFRGDRGRTLVRDLSGGERRRLQLMRLLMGEPNVLLLDEPTNDLDIDTLTALEDLLDGWPGTLVAVSHDRYFVERVCDDVYALSDGGVRHLPGGIDQYVAERRALTEPAPAPAPRAPSAPPAQAVLRAARKEAQRLERALDRLGEREASLHAAMAEAATDHVRLRELQAELGEVASERESLEAAWLEAAETLES